MACPETRVGDGLEAQFDSNHLGHFALIGPDPAADRRRRRARRVGFLARRSALGDRLESRSNSGTGNDKWEAYGQAKTANVRFAAYRLDRPAVAHPAPGDRRTPRPDLTPSTAQPRPKEEMQRAAGGIRRARRSCRSGSGLTAEQGASTQPWTATSKPLAGIGGVDCENCDVAVIDDEDDAQRRAQLRGGSGGGRAAVGSFGRSDTGQRVRLRDDDRVGRRDPSR